MDDKTGGWREAATVLALLRKAAVRKPDNGAFVSAEVRLTYRGYLHAVIGFVDEPQRLGATGNRVALLYANPAEAAVATLAILDRLKDPAEDMVIGGGYNVYPREVENVLLMHPAVQEAACFGISDAYRGEVLHAPFVLRETANVDDLMAHCRENLAKYKVLVSLAVVEAVPQTAVVKIDKVALRQAATGPW